MKNFQNKAKIIKVSKVIRHILFAGVVFGAIDILMVLIKIASQTPVVTSPISLGLQGCFVLMMVCTFIVSLQLFRFFDRLQNGFLFDARMVGHLAAAGRWLIVGWVFKIAHLFFQSPTDLPWDFGGLFAGLMFVFFAWLFKEAQELQEEQQLTV